MTHHDNLLLACLLPGDLALLQPHLKPIHLSQHQILFAQGGASHNCYFPLNAVISLVVGLSTGETVEAAMVGRDGVVSAASALDGKVALSTGVVQLGGDAMICPADRLKEAALESKTLLSLLIRHEQLLFAQAQQSTACMANHQVTARLCRWLLRARDLARSDHLPFTQEYLAEMLGVTRTSVTVEAHTLQRAGLIKYARGKIEILNAEGVEEGACECYAAVKQHYQALLGRCYEP